MPAADVMNLLVLDARPNNVQTRPIDGGEHLYVRTPRKIAAVAGQVLSVKAGERKRQGYEYIDGDIEDIVTDVARWGLPPVPVVHHGEWDPAEAWSDDEDDEPESAADSIDEAEQRPLLEIEAPLPGEDETEDTFDDDPILLAMAEAERGSKAAARQRLIGLIDQDPRCIDAHAHLGHLAFDRQVARALQHYDMGVAIADHALASYVRPALVAGLIGNRPLLRCLHGAALCLWRLERFEQAQRLLLRLLEADPDDGAGARFLVGPVARREAWRKGSDY